VWSYRRKLNDQSRGVFEGQPILDSQRMEAQGMQMSAVTQAPPVMFMAGPGGLPGGPNNTYGMPPGANINFGASQPLPPPQYGTAPGFPVVGGQGFNTHSNPEYVSKV
jgi:hypothetical protein